MSDLISRQEAKDAIDMALDHIDHVPPWVYDKLLNALNEVPSAEKAQLSEEDATKDATSDLISRTGATTIPVMPKEHREYQTMNLDDAYEQGWFDCQKSIEELPSAGGCKCPCEYREPCDYCHYDGHLGMGCPAEEGLKDG